MLPAPVAAGLWSREGGPGDWSAQSVVWKPLYLETPMASIEPDGLNAVAVCEQPTQQLGNPADMRSEIGCTENILGQVGEEIDR